MLILDVFISFDEVGVVTARTKPQRQQCHRLGTLIVPTI